MPAGPSSSTGPWGCTKTFLWKNSVVPELQRPHIYVSAFGAEGAASLNGRLLTHFALRMLGRVPLGAGAHEKVTGWWEKVRSKLGRPGSAIASALNSFGGAFLKRADIDLLELADLLEAGTILCIDAIEKVTQEELDQWARPLSPTARLRFVVPDPQ